MADLRKRAYAYLHRRLDTNDIFYVGIGLRDNFKRAYDKFDRSRWWHNIANKSEISIEIMKTNLARYRACTLEKILIKIYGRRNLGLGSLVNLTDGREGTIGYKFSQDHRKKQSLRMRDEKNLMYGKTHSEEAKKKISEFRKTFKISEKTSEKISLATSRGNNPRARLVVSLETGIFYDCLKDASEAHGYNYSNARNWLQNRCPNKTNLIYVNKEKKWDQ